MVHDLLAEEGKADPELQKGPAGFTIPDLTQSGEAGKVVCVLCCLPAQWEAAGPNSL